MYNCHSILAADVAGLADPVCYCLEALAKQVYPLVVVFYPSLPTPWMTNALFEQGAAQSFHHFPIPYFAILLRMSGDLLAL